MSDTEINNNKSDGKVKKSMTTLLAAMRLNMIYSTNSEGKHIVRDRRAKSLYTDYRSRFMKVGDLELHYQVEGSGPDLVLLHGFGGSLHLWDSWTVLLKEHFRVIRLDLPGFGLSSPIKDTVGVDFFVKALHAFLGRLQVDKCFLVGNSLGGWIAWEYASLFTQQIEKVVLMAPAGYFDPQNPRPKGVNLLTLPVFRKLLKTGIPKNLIRRILRNVYGRKKMLTQEIIDRYYVIANREGNLNSMMSVAISEAISNIENLKKITQPSLILWGKKDRVINPDFAACFHSDIRNSRLTLYDKAGHVVMVEEPKKSAKEVKDFLCEPGKRMGTDPLIPNQYPLSDTPQTASYYDGFQA